MRKETIPRDKKRSPHLRETGFWNPRNFWLWKPESWALEFGKQQKEYGIPLTIDFQNPSSTDKESDIQDQESGNNNFISFSKHRSGQKPEKLKKIIIIIIYQFM